MGRPHLGRWLLSSSFELLPTLLYAFPRPLFGLASPFAHALGDLLLHLRSALVYLLLDALPAPIHLFLRTLADLFFHPSASYRARKGDEGDHEEDEKLSFHACPSCVWTYLEDPFPRRGLPKRPSLRLPMPRRPHRGFFAPCDGMF